MLRAKIICTGSLSAVQPALDLWIHAPLAQWSTKEKPGKTAESQS